MPIVPIDPYQTPTANQAPRDDSAAGIIEKEAAAQTAVAPLVAEHLRGTRPWVKFCSIAGYVTSGFLVLIALFTLRGLIGSPQLLKPILFSGFYVILALLFIIPSRSLSRYEKSITHLNISHQIEDLEQALADQRTFWKHTAIMIILLLIIYLLSIAFSAIVLLSGRISV